MTRRGTFAITNVVACVACVVGVGGCATSSTWVPDRLAGKPHVAVKLASVQRVDEVLGGCSISTAFENGDYHHEGRRTFDCGDFIVQTEEASPSPLPPSEY